MQGITVDTRSRFQLIALGKWLTAAMKIRCLSMWSVKCTFVSFESLVYRKFSHYFFTLSMFTLDINSVIICMRMWHERTNLSKFYTRSTSQVRVRIQLLGFFFTFFYFFCFRYFCLHNAVAVVDLQHFSSLEQLLLWLAAALERYTTSLSVHKFSKKSWKPLCIHL